MIDIEGRRLPSAAVRLDPWEQEEFDLHFGDEFGTLGHRNICHKGGGGTETVTQQATIPDFLKPFVKEQSQIGNEALRNLRGQMSGAGAEELVTPFNQDQVSALNMARDRITGQENPFQISRDVMEGTARGDFLFGGQGFDQAVDAAVRSALPQVASVFGGAGRGTGGLAQAAIGEAATDAFASMFNTERQRQLGAAGSLPGMSLADTDALFRLGGIRQSQDQRELMAPITAQESLLAAAGGGVPLQSLLGQSQTSPLHNNSAAGMLGGAATGAGIASAMSLSNPWTAALAIGGGLLGSM